MEYRSCIYTCDSDGCNEGSIIDKFTLSSIILIVAITTFLFK